MRSQAQTLMIYDPKVFFQEILGGALTDFSGWDVAKKMLISNATNTVIGVLSDMIKPGSRDALTLVAQTASDLLTDYGISEDNLNYYKFKLNPTDLMVGEKKIRVDKFTGAGWDIDTRGADMKQYRFVGNTGSLMPELKNNSTLLRHLEILVKNLRNVSNSSSAIGAGILSTYYDWRNLDFDRILGNPRLSASYVKYLLFKLFWEGNNGDLIIIFEDDAYIGKFNNYSFKFSAEDPYKITYDFDFSVYPNFSYNLLTGYIDTDLNSIFTKFLKNTPTKSLQDLSSNIANNVSQESSSTKTFLEKIGDVLYNKNRINFNQTLQKGTIDISKVTPKELAIMYQKESGIDILGETIQYDFNLKPSDNLTTNVSQITSSASSSSEQVKEYSILENNGVGG